MYWAVTIPLTLAVIVIYRLWMGFQRDNTKEHASLQQEKTAVVQSLHEANLALVTPFYPGMGKPGHII